MKRMIFVVVYSLVLGVAFMAGNFFGKTKAEDKAAFTLEVAAEQQLALLLEALNELESDNISKVQWMLQASAVGQFETIINGAKFENKSLSRFCCALLKKYKNYYKEKKLFSTQAWAPLMEVEGMREAKEKREDFFERRLPEICPESK